MSDDFDLKICCMGAGYVGGPTMAVIAKMCPKVREDMTEFHRVLVCTHEFYDQTSMAVNIGTRTHTSHALRLNQRTMHRLYHQCEQRYNTYHIQKIDSTRIFRLKIDSRLRC